MDIELNGEVKIHYEEKGCGEVLILLHGNGENHEYFKGQIDFFSKLYRVIAIDTRGHGKSERGEKPFTISQFADDLNDFMKEKCIRKAHILGFSDGGNIAMVFAIRYKEKVDKLILNGANMFGKGMKIYVQVPIILGYVMAKMFENIDSKSRASREMLGLMVHDPNLTSEDLRKIEARTLVIAGKKDMIKEKHTRLIDSCIANSKLVIMEGNHFVANKRPEAFNMEVLRFLGE